MAVWGRNASGAVTKLVCKSRWKYNRYYHFHNTAWRVLTLPDMWMKLQIKKALISAVSSNTYETLAFLATIYNDRNDQIQMCLLIFRIFIKYHDVRLLSLRIKFSSHVHCIKQNYSFHFWLTNNTMVEDLSKNELKSRDRFSINLQKLRRNVSLVVLTEPTVASLLSVIYFTSWHQLNQTSTVTFHLGPCIKSLNCTMSGIGSAWVNTLSPSIHQSDGLIPSPAFHISNHPACNDV
jgi:hypothetical protein